jgi:hypothetical protein
MRLVAACYTFDTSHHMLFSLRKKSPVSPLSPYIGAFVCFCFSGLFSYLAFTQVSPTHLFPFTQTAIALSCFALGVLIIVRPEPKPSLRASEFHGNFVGIIVGVFSCVILGGVILDSHTQALGWQHTPATVTGLPFIRLPRQQQQFTVQYQYTWQDTLFNGATTVTPSALGDEPRITISTRRSLSSRPLEVGDQIKVKVNPKQPGQSLYPQTPSFLIYPLLLLFAGIAWGCFRRLQNPPKLGEFKP